MDKIYGYARTSSQKQNIERQLENILNEFPTATLIQEKYTGTTIDRPKFNNMKKAIERDLNAGLKVTIVFDSVSRMSRNSTEGINQYMEFFDKGIELVFLKEQYINTDVYRNNIEQTNNVKVDDKDLNNTIMEGIREYLKLVAIKQIQIAFDQSEKEVKDIQQRTKEGIKKARDKAIENGQDFNIGNKKGDKLVTKKSIVMKEKIKQLSKDFNGAYKDTEVMELINLSRNTYYRYKKQLIGESAGE